MSMLGKAVSAGTQAAMYRNPIYRGYQDTITLLGNKSNGLLTKDSTGKSRANANSSGVTPNEILQNMNGGKDSSATTVTQKFSDVKDTLSNLGKKK